MDESERQRKISEVREALQRLKSQYEHPSITLGKKVMNEVESLLARLKAASPEEIADAFEGTDVKQRIEEARNFLTGVQISMLNDRLKDLERTELRGAVRRIKPAKKGKKVRRQQQHSRRRQISYQEAWKQVDRESWRRGVMPKVVSAEFLRVYEIIKKLDLTAGELAHRVSVERNKRDKDSPRDADGYLLPIDKN